MNWPRTPRALVGSILICALVLQLAPPSLAVGAPPALSLVSQAPRTKLVVDVALTAQGQLVGQLVDDRGAGLRAVRVAVQQDQREIAVGLTDEQGVFSIPVVRGGVYQVVAPDTLVFCRAWVAGTAPPHTAERLLVVAGGAIARGQNGLYGWISEHPVLFYTGLAAAIVVPIVVVSGSRDRDSGS